MSDSADEIARKLECVTEQEFITLFGITPSTAKAWRTRGTAPLPVRIGTRYLYPLAAIKAVITERTRAPKESHSGVIV